MNIVKNKNPSLLHFMKASPAAGIPQTMNNTSASFRISSKKL